MSKRFTATEKWEDPWFCSLTVEERLFWIYLLDKCDHAGIWQVNWMLVNTYFPGFAFEKSKFAQRIIEITPAKWFIPKFLKFQYPNGLRNDWKATASVIKILSENNILDTVRELFGYSFLTVLDKDKDKDKEKEGGVGETKQRKTCAEYSEKFDALWKMFPNGKGKKMAYRHYSASVKTMDDEINIAKALDNYVKSKRVRDGFVQNGSTWFNNWQDWINHEEPKTKEDKKNDLVELETAIKRVQAGEHVKF